MPNARNDSFGIERRSISFNQSVNFFAMARSDGGISAILAKHSFSVSVRPADAAGLIAARGNF